MMFVRNTEKMNLFPLAYVMADIERDIRCNADCQNIILLLENAIFWWSSVQGIIW